MGFDVAKRSQIILPSDMSRIDVGDENQIGFWAEHFGVSREKLERVIGEVGNWSSQVERRLNQID